MGGWGRALSRHHGVGWRVGWGVFPSSPSLSPSLIRLMASVDVNHSVISVDVKLSVTSCTLS